MTESDDIPRANVVREEPNPSVPGHLLVWITCPHCGEEHMHGMPEDERDTHRGSHCVSKESNAGYFIVRNH